MAPTGRKSTTQDEFPKSPSVARWKASTPKKGRRKSYQFNDIRESPSETLFALSKVLAEKIPPEKRRVSHLRNEYPETVEEEPEPTQPEFEEDDDSLAIEPPPVFETDVDRQLYGDDDTELSNFRSPDIQSLEKRLFASPTKVPVQEPVVRDEEAARLMKDGTENAFVRRMSLGVGFADRFEDLKDEDMRLRRMTGGSTATGRTMEDSLLEDMGMNDTTMMTANNYADDSLDLSPDPRPPRLSMEAESALLDFGDDADDSLDITLPLGANRRDTITQFDFLPHAESAAPTPAKPAAIKPKRKKKEKPEGAYMPEAVIRKLTSRLGYKGLSKETIGAIGEASRLFLEQASDDLKAYADHAGRKTITSDDMYQLLRRQRLGKDSTEAFHLAQKHLPRELITQIARKPTGA